jgi:hypothetical protein
MFQAVKRLAVSVAVKSFVLRLAAIESAHDIGKMSDSDYDQQRAQILLEYQQYLLETPGDLVPDWAKQIG